jgi:Uma2 family endonuclease
MRKLLNPPAAHPFTQADWDLLPEGFPAQLVEGRLVKEPAIALGHQRLASATLESLQALVGSHRAVPRPLDVVVNDQNVYQPDIVVLRAPLPDDARFVRRPLLVVEVLLPSTGRRDRDVKRRRLLETGTGEVWIVDPATATVEVHAAGGSRRAYGGAPIESLVLPGFRLVPSALFAPPEQFPRPL